jgi:hypothetical protein
MNWIHNFAELNVFAWQCELGLWMLFERFEHPNSVAVSQVISFLLQSIFQYSQHAAWYVSHASYLETNKTQTFSAANTKVRQHFQSKFYSTHSLTTYITSTSILYLPTSSIFQVVSFQQVSSLKFCVHFFSRLDIWHGWELTRNACTALVGKLVGKSPRSWGNIKMEDGRWMELAQDRVFVISGCCRDTFG